MEKWLKCFLIQGVFYGNQTIKRSRKATGFCDKQKTNFFDLFKKKMCEGNFHTTSPTFQLWHEE